MPDPRSDLRRAALRLVEAVEYAVDQLGRFLAWALPDEDDLDFSDAGDLLCTCKPGVPEHRHRPCSCHEKDCPRYDPMWWTRPHP